jgi:hypothetical protein
VTSEKSIIGFFQKAKSGIWVGIRSLVEGLALCYDRNVKKLLPAKSGEKQLLKNEVGVEAHAGGKRPGREAAEG